MQPKSALVGATALALFRGSSIWYWFYVMHASGGRTAIRLILLPEGMTLYFLNQCSNWLFGAPIITDPDRTMVVVTVLAFVGSYILASPLMLVCSKREVTGSSLVDKDG